ncbi:MAG: transporter ATP-binding protein [Rhizobium sp.]|nr:transporter ATP-binding protein [Rhizobium sp.]
MEALIEDVPGLTGAPDALLKVEDLSVSVSGRAGPIEIIDRLSIASKRGETLCLVGESGCGKSMTALALMGLLPENASRNARKLIFDGIDLQGLSRNALDRLRGDQVAMIFQDPSTAFNPSMTIGDQLEEVWLRHRKGSRALARERALFLLERVGIADPARRAKQFPHQLSGGLKQRAMIAMALMCEPKLLIADEPTTALDVTIQAQVLRLLLELQREMGLGLVLITHDFGVVSAMASHVAVMYAGLIVESGPAQDVLRNPHHPYTRGLLACFPSQDGRRRRLETIAGSVPSPGTHGQGCRYYNRCPQSAPECLAPPIALEPCGPQRTVRCTRWQMTPPAPGNSVAIAEPDDDDVKTNEAPPLLEIAALTQSFQIGRGIFGRTARLQALRGVSLRLHQNETVAIVGESGCGKSTLAKIALGLLVPDSGDVYLNGVPIQQTPRRDVSRAVQPIFQDPFASLTPHRRIGEAVAVPLQTQGIGTPAQRKQRALEMMERVGLPSHFAERLPIELSGGQLQRVAIARALVLEPSILVCDEPTSALDVSVQAQILNLLADLKASLGLSILLITHNFAVIRQLADRVAVMYLGRIIEEGSAKDILSEPRHHYTRLLMSSNLDPHIQGGGLARNIADVDFPNPLSPPTGCAFHPRCPSATNVCVTTDPMPSAMRNGFVACHHPHSYSTLHAPQEQ